MYVYRTEEVVKLEKEYPLAAGLRLVVFTSLTYHNATYIMLLVVFINYCTFYWFTFDSVARMMICQSVAVGIAEDVLVVDADGRGVGGAVDLARLLRHGAEQLLALLVRRLEGGEPFL